MRNEENSIISLWFQDILKVYDGVLGVACALRGVSDHIDEVSVIRLFYCGRNGEATHAKETEVCCYHSRTDGAVGGFGVGFDVDDYFHGGKCFE